MKRTGTKIMALLLGLSLGVSGVAMGGTESSAKMKLNKTKYTLRVGKTLKLKVKGTKKKAKWSSSKKKVATVSKKGVVKAKNAGKATITAKVGKKKLQCKITVKKETSNGNTNSKKVVNKSNEELAKSLEVKAEQAVDGSVLFSIKNKNETIVNYASLTAKWKDAEGKEKSRELTVYFLPAGETCYLASRNYTTHDENGRAVYVKQNLSTMTYSAITVNKDYAETKDMTSTAGITQNPLVPDKHWASVRIENKSNITYDFSNMTVGLYDAAGQLLSVATQSFASDDDPYLSPNGQWTFSFNYPQDFANDDYLDVKSYKMLYLMICSKAQ